MIIEQYELPVVGNEMTDRDRAIEAMAFRHENKVTKLASRQERLNARLARLASKAESRKATASKVRRIASKAVSCDAHVSLWAAVMFSVCHQAYTLESYSALIGGVR